MSAQPADPVEFDPRPVLGSEPSGVFVSGLRCQACRYPTAASVASCPVCGGEVRPDRFGPSGTVSAATCIRVRVPGRTPPYAVAYLDLDDGPRVLVHTPGDAPARPGSRLRLGTKNEHGDLTADGTPA